MNLSPGKAASKGINWPSAQEWGENRLDHLGISYCLESAELAGAVKELYTRASSLWDLESVGGKCHKGSEDSLYILCVPKHNLH